MSCSYGPFTQGGAWVIYKPRPWGPWGYLLVVGPHGADVVDDGTRVGVEHLACPQGRSAGCSVPSWGLWVSWSPASQLCVPRAGQLCQRALSRPCPRVRATPAKRGRASISELQHWAQRVSVIFFTPHPSPRASSLCSGKVLLEIQREGLWSEQRDPLGRLV